MKNRNRILALALSAITLFSVTGCGNEEIELPAKLDYSASTKQFEYYGYSSLHDGEIDVEGKTFYIGNDFINEQYISDYFDSGMKIMLPQSSAAVGTVAVNDWENSKIKRVLDMTHELGYDKSVVVTDNRFYALYNNAVSWANQRGYGVEGTTVIDGKEVENWTLISLIGEGKQFASEEELDAEVEKYLSLYKDHPAWRGIMLPDEPSGIYLKPIGELYKSAFRVAKKLGINDFFINANLWPMVFVKSSYETRFPSVPADFAGGDNSQRAMEAYRRYIERWFLATTESDGTTAKTVQVDIYPLGNQDSVLYYYIACLQIMAQEAKKHDAKIAIVSQTMTLNSTRILKYEDLRYLNNIQMGFGAKSIGYFTYYTHEDYEGRETYNDNGSMVTRFGEKTDVYYSIQKLNLQSQKLAPVILNFDYLTSKLYLDDNASQSSTHMLTPMSYLGQSEFSTFVKLVDFSLNKEMAVVTELYDKEKDNYMYMVMNTINPQALGVGAYETATLTFSGEYTHAWVYYDGVFKAQKLDDGNKVTVKMNPGKAHYIIPFAM